ncbi:uncharacterized protein LOC106674366 [Cimex lectularius]|uniref:Odorant receptor n=1 Tax=Cimex lectularius TaxID=79782 RepID=A0A8I6SR06_CIMLE|nr:uncharacterized protein LOC106674366 [Cimex lectularius]
MAVDVKSVQTPSQRIYAFAIIGGMGYNPRKKNPLAVYCYVSAITFYLFPSIIGSFCHVFSDDTSAMRVEAFQITCSVLNILFRHLNVLLRIRFVMRMVEELDEMWAEMIGENIIPDEFVKVDARLKRFMVSNLVFYLAPMTLIVAEWLRINYGLSAEEIRWLYPISTPFPNEWVYSVFLAQLLVSLVVLMSDAGSINILYGATLYIGHFLNCLQEMVKTRENFDERIFKFHIKILRQVSYYNNFFSASCFFVVLVNGFEVSVRIYRAMTNEGNDFLQNAIFSLVLLFPPFVISYCGSHLWSQNEILFLQTYQNEWYVQTIKRKKELWFLMKIASRPVTFHFHDLCTFGMPQFTSFCQGILSYIALLKFFLNER